MRVASERSMCSVYLSIISLDTSSDVRANTRPDYFLFLDNTREEEKSRCVKSHLSPGFLETELISLPLPPRRPVESRKEEQNTKGARRRLKQNATPHLLDLSVPTWQRADQSFLSGSHISPGAYFWVNLCGGASVKRHAVRVYTVEHFV
ncbi:hypothetical protein GW17_00018403 [Ensete ventricosum]|nr:hypothetical protein GW17_00018403 [Ensete ventricosum]